MTEEVRESRFGGTDFNTEITLQNEAPEDVEEEEAAESEDVETAEDSIKIDPVTGKIILPDNSLIPVSDYDRILEDLETEDFNND
jgi:hypothetical protein